MGPEYDRYKRIMGLATINDLVLGAEFYSSAWAWCVQRSRTWNVPATNVAYCVAAISPMKKWDENLRLTDLVLDFAYGTGTHLPLMRKRADAAMNALVYGEVPSGPKVSCFARNIAGDLTAVTIDRHMMDMAESKDIEGCKRAVTDLCTHYDTLWPAQVQAVLWYTWRRLKGYAAYELPA